MPEDVAEVEPVELIEVDEVSIEEPPEPPMHGEEDDDLVVRDIEDD